MNRLRLRKNALSNLKHPLHVPHLRAEFLERIVRTIRGFTVPHLFTLKLKKNRIIIGQNWILMNQYQIKERLNQNKICQIKFKINENKNSSKQIKILDKQIRLFFRIFIHISYFFILWIIYYNYPFTFNILLVCTLYMIKLIFQRIFIAWLPCHFYRSSPNNNIY